MIQRELNRAMRLTDLDSPLLNTIEQHGLLRRQCGRRGGNTRHMAFRGVVPTSESCDSSLAKVYRISRDHIEALGFRVNRVGKESRKPDSCDSLRSKKIRELLGSTEVA